MSNELITALQSAAGNAGGDFYPYTVDYSARFNDNDSAYLTRTLGAGNTKKWTWSGWVKQSTAEVNAKTLFSCNSSRANAFYISYAGGGHPTVPTIGVDIHFNGTRYIRYADIAIRDVSAWYHVVVALDTTQATDSDRLKLYINGSDVPLSNAQLNGWPPLNSDGDFNSAIVHSISRREVIPDDYFDGYLSQVCFIDGQQLDPTSFGEYKNGVWVPKDPSGLTFGTNGFYLDFADSSALGNDVSGNNNDFTSSGLTSTDQMIDTPTNNFATLNPLVPEQIGTNVYSEGNLKSSASSNSGYPESTIHITSGKYYVEMYYESGYTASGDGLGFKDTTAFGILYRSNGAIFINGSLSTTVSSYTQGDIVSMFIDADAGEAKFYKNNTLVYTGSSLTYEEYIPFVYNREAGSLIVNFGQDSSFAGNVTRQSNTDANGNGDFYYAPPTGALALCTANLPEPVIGPNSDTLSGENFNTVLYTGNGSTQSITGVNYQPDFTWIKDRDATYGQQLFDVLRGAENTLRSDTNVAEYNQGAQYGGLTSFDSDGFSVDVGTDVDVVNTTGNDYVSWNWKANGSGVSNTDGSITSTVSANQDAGFSIVTYTGTGSAGATVGHGLSSAPNLVFFKNRGYAYSWLVQGDALGSPASGYYMWLDRTDAVTTDSSVNTTFGGSTITLDYSPAYNQSGYNIVAYCFAEVEGFSKFGSYTGNGSSDGSFVHTGFRPAMVIVKQTNAARDWHIMDAARDPYNVVNDILLPNSAINEYTDNGNGLDFFSNGFKWRTGDAGFNGSGGTYIYMAFAENPFKYSTAR